MAELKNRAPLIEQHGHPAEERVLLPASYIITIAYREKDAGAVKGKLTELIKPCEAEILSDRIAQHEWKNRFKLMVVKTARAKPHTDRGRHPACPSSGDVMEEIEHKVNQPIVKEGVVIREGKNGKPEVVILGFIPADQRKFTYNFVFSLAMTVIKIAEKHGGRAYSTGLYFAKKAKEVLGKERVGRIKEFKKKNDPKDILNPGKVIGNGFLGTVMGVAKFLEPFGRPFGNYVITKIGERPTETGAGYPGRRGLVRLRLLAVRLLRRGVRPVLRPRLGEPVPAGQVVLAARIHGGPREVEPVHGGYLPGLHHLRAVQPALLGGAAHRAVVDEAARQADPRREEDDLPALRDDGGGPHQGGGHLGGLPQEPLRTGSPRTSPRKHGPGEKAKTVYFAGCTASYVEHDIAMASVRLLDEAGVDFVTSARRRTAAARRCWWPASGTSLPRR